MSAMPGARPGLEQRLSDGLARLKREVVALWFCARHPRTPFLAKLVAAAVVAYAFSPIDLIPDFIPVVGVLDDLLLLPLGVWLVLRLVPSGVMAECRERSAAWLATGGSQPRSYAGAAVIVALWLALAAALWLAYRHWRGA